jgi:hypothetical protein
VNEGSKLPAPSKTPRLEAFAVHFTPLLAPEGFGYPQPSASVRVYNHEFSTLAIGFSPERILLWAVDGHDRDGRVQIELNR